MNEIYETATRWLVENPGWRLALLTLWGITAGHVLSYMICVFGIGLRKTTVALEGRQIARQTCAWPIYLATWPARKLWRWWRGWKVKPGTEIHWNWTQCQICRSNYSWISVVPHDESPGCPKCERGDISAAKAKPGYTIKGRELSPEEAAAQWRSGSFKAAAGYAASGSAPDEAGRPVTRKELDIELNTLVDTQTEMLWRLAALEAAQKPAPEDAYEPVGTLPVVGDRVRWPWGTLDTREVWEVARVDRHSQFARGWHASMGECYASLPGFLLSDGHDEACRILKRQKPAQPGVWIDGAWWRGWNFTKAATVYLCRGDHDYFYRAWSGAPWRPSPCARWADGTPIAEASESEVRAMHAEAKKQGVV